MFIIIVFWLGSERASDFFFSCPFYLFPYSRLSSFRLRGFIILFHACCSHARVFGKTRLHELPITYIAMLNGLPSLFSKRRDRNCRSVASEILTKYIYIYNNNNWFATYNYVIHPLRELPAFIFRNLVHFKQICV